MYMTGCDYITSGFFYAVNMYILLFLLDNSS